MSTPVLPRPGENVALAEADDIAVTYDSKRPYGIRKQLYRQYAHASVKPPLVLFVEFIRLAHQWRQDTAQSSSLNEKFQHPAYREIIDLGPEVVPIILRDLRTRPDYWFSALTSITGQDPISPLSYGNLDEMVSSWVEWAQQRGVRF
ncbi:MAG: hypothetical protein GIW98_03350 [Candidatus Eremiobacteraeota bacterium]|nr:hypothetical protein [Candidatus Eremiobacteraeota bacterium]